MVLAGLLALWAQPAAQGQVAQPYEGVTYIDRWIEAPRRVHLHIAQIVTGGTATVPAYRDPGHADALLEPGGPGTYSNEKAWADVTTARTAIGLSRDRRTLTLFTADVRGGSEGMRLGEVAELLIRSYGVWDALNLDGGGSTSMAMADPATGEAALVNTSSDNPSGREVATSLVVFARRAPR